MHAHNPSQPGPALPRHALPQKDREARALAQRLEASAAQCGLLDDSVAGLKRRAAELGTALAQRDVTVRQLEDRLRALQARQGSLFAS